MSLAVYTVIMGGYDKLRPPLVVSEKADYLCFTDMHLPETPPWKQISAMSLSDSRRASRFLKIMIPADVWRADYSLYRDGNVRLKIDPIEAIDRWLVNHDMAVCAHPHRDCIYEEAKCCLKGGPAYEPERIGKQMMKYLMEGYPQHRGLPASTIILRRHTEEIKRFNEAWWREVAPFSVRDQLSFNYVAWKLGIKYDIIPGNLFEHEDFDYFNHGGG